jgi:hypothetical protein
MLLDQCALWSYVFTRVPYAPSRDTEVEVTLQMTASQSVCKGVEPTLGLVTRYYFLTKGCRPKVAVLSLWDALSDERSGLSFVILSL